VNSIRYRVQKFLDKSQVVLISCEDDARVKRIVTSPKAMLAAEHISFAGRYDVDVPVVKRKEADPIVDPEVKIQNEDGGTYEQPDSPGEQKES